MSRKGLHGTPGMIRPGDTFKTDRGSLEAQAGLAQEIQESMRQELWPAWADEPKE